MNYSTFVASLGNNAGGRSTNMRATTHDAATSSRYHIERVDYDDDVRGCTTNGRTSSCSSRSSWSQSQARSTWTDATHDTDFRPLPSPTRYYQKGHSRSRSIHMQPRRSVSCGLAGGSALGYRERSMSPPRSHRTTPTLEDRPRSSSPAPPSSYYYPPSKAVRRAARQQLDPVLREAIRAHEREMARARKHERRPSWLRGRSSSSAVDTYDTEDASMVCDEDYLEDITRSPAAYSPPPLPELSLYPDDVESEESLHEMDQGRRSSSPTSEQIKYRLASLSLRIDLALFRAKKHFLRRIGIRTR